MKQIGFKDTIRIGVYAGETVKDCIKKYGKKSLLEVLMYYDLDDELSRKYYHKKDDQKVEVQTIEMKDEEYPHPWEGSTERNYQEYFETYDEMVEQTFVTSSTMEMGEEYFEPVDEVVDDPWYCPGGYDPEDDYEFGENYGYVNSYKPWIYGK